MKLIDCYSYEGNGYNPYLIAQGWQIAQLNYSEENKFYSIHKMDVHHQTDEAFILQKGTVILIAAHIEEDNITFELELLTKAKTYNIPAECWHNLMMSEDAEVIIVETANTHLSDFEYYALSPAQKNKLDQKVCELLNGNRIVLQ